MDARSQTGYLGFAQFRGVYEVAGTYQTSQILETVERCAANGGGYVYVPAGTWSYDAQVVVPSGVYVGGAGPQATLISGGGAEPPFLLGSAGYTSSPRHRFVGIENMAVIGNFTGGCVEVSSVQNGWVRNMDLWPDANGSFALQLHNEARYIDVYMVDTRRGNWCLRMEDGFRSCRVSMCQFRAITGTQNGVYLGGTVTGGSNAYLVMNNVVAFAGIGIHLDGSAVTVDKPVLVANRIESTEPGTPNGIQTDGAVLNPYGFCNYFGSGASVNNVQNNSGTYEANQYGFHQPNIRFVDNFQPTGSRDTFTGTGDPNGNVVGNPGDRYLNDAGGAGQTFWVKESGVGTNTGWVAK